MLKVKLKNARLVFITGLALLANPSSVFAHHEHLGQALMYGVVPFGFVILGVGLLYLQIDKLRN